MDLPVARFLRPATLEEALALLAEEPGARPVAGGTDLSVQLRDGRRRTETLVQVDHLVPAGVVETAGGLEIGAATTMEAIARDPRVGRACPALAEAAAHVGAWPIQCRATLGGNLANASPAADTAPPLLVADALVRVVRPGGSREIPVASFFLGPGRTCLAPGELIASVLLPPPPAGALERFVKVGPRAEQVISVVSLAARLVPGRDGRLEHVRLALGSVAPTPVRARRAEAALSGRRPDARVRREAVAALEDDIVPIDDVRGTARYRRLAAAVLLDRVLEDLDA